MNILIIGNGFDLAHGMPTSYKDFLNFYRILMHGIELLEENRDIKNMSLVVGDKDICKAFDKGIRTEVLTYIKDLLGACRKNAVNCIKIDSEGKSNDMLGGIRFWHRDPMNGSLSEKNIRKREDVDATLIYDLGVFKRLLSDNFWIVHFEDVEIKNNWVDFESEVSKICEVLEIALGDSNSGDDNTDVTRDISEVRDKFRRFFCQGLGYRVLKKQGINLESLKDTNRISVEVLFKIRDILVDSLDRLTLALELYLIRVVEGRVLPKIEPVDTFTKLNIDKVLSFNYTHTWSKLYTTDEVVYLHGQTREQIKHNQSPLVLGMNESLEGEKSSQNTNLIKFKKYYQRIRKLTGDDYKKWIKYLEFEDCVKGENFGSCYDTYCQVKCKKTGNRKLRYIASKLDISQSNDSDFLTNAEEFFNTFYNDPSLNTESSCVYICGHSLDVTDKDVLSQFIDYDNIKVVIYYGKREPNPVAKRELESIDEQDLDLRIEQLVKIVGRQNLIRRRSDHKTVTFRNINTGEEN